MELICASCQGTISDGGSIMDGWPYHLSCAQDKAEEQNLLNRFEEIDRPLLENLMETYTVNDLEAVLKSNWALIYESAAGLTFVEGFSIKSQMLAFIADALEESLDGEELGITKAIQVLKRGKVIEDSPKFHIKASLKNW